MIVRGLVVIVMVFALGAVGGQCAVAQGTATIVVKLLDTAAVHHDTVCLGDIAEIDAPSPALAKRLKGVDLTVMDHIGETQSVSAKQVRARLMLEGIDRRTLQLTGADETQVSLAPQSVVIAESKSVDFANDVISQAVERLASAWLVAKDDIEVLITSSQTGLIARDGSKAIPELDLPTKLEPGRIQARLKWAQNGKIERFEQITLEVRLRQTVVLASLAIGRGEQLNGQNVIEDRRLLSQRVEQINAEKVMGYVAKRGLNPGEVLSSKDLATIKRTAPQVHARDGVRVVAKKGRLTVVLQQAVALQPGLVGDVINVQNMQTRQIISARVVSPQEVEVALD